MFEGALRLGGGNRRERDRARAAGRPDPLPGLRGAACALGARARARGADALRRAAAAAAARPVRALHTTHVLLPATFVPRRRDCTQVIGQALFAAACGAGHRTIAAELDRPPGTVRGWLRAFGRCGEALGRWGWRWAISLGEEVPCQWPAESPVADGVEALRWAYEACVERLGCIADFWELLVAMSGGYLLHEFGRFAAERRERHGLRKPETLGRAGARSRRYRRSVSPTRPPNPACVFLRTGLSTGHAVAGRDAGFMRRRFPAGWWPVLFRCPPTARGCCGRDSGIGSLVPRRATRALCLRGWSSRAPSIVA